MVLIKNMLPDDKFKLLRQQAVKLEIMGETIGKLSIKYNSNDLPQWTKACKYYLTKLQNLILLSVLRDQNEQL